MNKVSPHPFHLEEIWIINNSKRDNQQSMKVKEDQKFLQLGESPFKVWSKIE